MDTAREHPSVVTATMERLSEKLDNLSDRMLAIEARMQMNASPGSYNLIHYCLGHHLCIACFPPFAY